VCPDSSHITVNRERLIIRGWATHWIAGLLGACVGLALVNIFLIPKRGILPTDPSGLPGLASLLQKSPELTEKLRHFGAANEKELSSLLGGTSFSTDFGKPQLQTDRTFPLRIQPGTTMAAARDL
jgi:hypothetical protein